MKLTTLFQEDIVAWLRFEGEGRAADWFSSNWCGEYGNYTNATAGYVGNCMASGIESHWKYAKRDIVGTSGTNQRISLGVFAGALVRYMKTTSERHAERKVYSQLFHNTDDFNVDFPMLTLKDKLDCMERFDRVAPLSVKCGEMVANCTCNNSYRSLCCVECVVFSMLFNTELVVPSTDRDTRVKAKTKEKVNPFNAAAVRKKKEEKEARAVSCKWAPSIPTSKEVLPMSAADGCVRKETTRRLHDKVSNIVCIDYANVA